MIYTDDERLNDVVSVVGYELFEEHFYDADYKVIARSNHDVFVADYYNMNMKCFKMEISWDDDKEIRKDFLGL